MLAVGLAPIAAGAGERYADAEFGYALTAPAGWTRKTSMPRPMVAFLGPLQGGFQTNFFVDPEPTEHKTLAQIVKVARAADAKNPAIRVRRQRSSTLGGHPAVVLDSIVTLKGQPPVFTRRVVTIYGDLSYTLTFSAVPEALKKDATLFNRVAASFRFPEDADRRKRSRGSAVR